MTCDPPDARLIAKAPEMRDFLVWFAEHNKHAAVGPPHNALLRVRALLALIDGDANGE